MNYLIIISISIIVFFLIIWLIFHQAREYYLQKDDMLHELKRIISPVHKKILDVKLYEGSKSYTINKEKIYLCLKDENGHYYNKNMLIYVTLHELAHVLNDDIGHTDSFHEKFEELLDKATELGIYNPSIPVIDNYCMY